MIPWFPLDMPDTAITKDITPPAVVRFIEPEGRCVPTISYQLEEMFEWRDKTAMRPPVVGYRKLRIVRKRDFVLKALPGELLSGPDE